MNKIVFTVAIVIVSLVKLTNGGEISKEYINKDIQNVNKGFLYVFEGEWKSVLINEEDSNVVTMFHISKEWFERLISKEYNPYLNDKLIVTKKYFLGVGKYSPDKIISEIENKKSKIKFTVIETKQEFIIDISPMVKVKEKNNKNILHDTDSSEIDVLSKECLLEFKKNITFNINKKDCDPFSKEDPIYDLFFPKVILNAAQDWKDRVGLFYYNKRIYLQFYKLQEGSATSIFTGLYWFSYEIRKKNNVLIPIEPKLNSVAKELMKNRGN